MVDGERWFLRRENACLYRGVGGGVMLSLMMTENANNDQPVDLRPMLSVKQVLKAVPMSRATLYREMDAGHFPAARAITPNASPDSPMM